MSLLRWAPGERQDRDALRAFRCTEPGRRVKRPHGWDIEHRARHELRVQAIIHRDLAPAGTPGRTVLLGWAHDDSLAAVSTYRTIGSGQFQIDVIAVALEYRSRGRAWAVETLVTTLDYITADADALGYSHATVAVQIHEDHHASQRLFGSQRFIPTSEGPESYQTWSATFPVAGVMPPEEL